MRVSPDILEHMKAGDLEPVVILGVDEQDDGTYVMTLKAAQSLHAYRELCEMVDAHYSGSLDHQPAYVRAIRTALREEAA